MSIRAFLTALLLLVAVPAWAQFDAGTVLGTVRDSSGGVLPGVTVTLRSIDTGIAATRSSDERGNFEFPTFRIGTFVVTSELAGFSPREVTNLRVEIGARLRVDVELSVGTVSEAISVTGAAPMLQTEV